MDYGHPAPPPPPPPRRFHIHRCHHYADHYYPYSREYVDRRAKIGLLAGVSAVSMLFGGLIPALVGTVGLTAAGVMAIRTALGKKTAVAPPDTVVYEDSVGYHR